MTVDGGLESELPGGASRPWYVVHPRGRLAIARDTITMVALALVFWVVPFQIAFVDEPPIPKVDGMWIFNRLLDVAFVFDLVVTFFVAVPVDALQEDEMEQAAAEEDDEGGGGSRTQLPSIEYETSLWRIAVCYARGWLVLDVLSLVPSAFDIYFLAITSGADDSDGGSNSGPGVAATRLSKLVKLIRITRVIRLMRLMRIGKMLADEDSGFRQLFDYLSALALSHGRKLRIVKLLVYILLISHMLGCLIGMTTIFADEKLYSWWGTHGYCWPDQLISLGPGHQAARCVDAWHQYWVCFHFALSLIFLVTFIPFPMEGPGEPYFAPVWDEEHWIGNSLWRSHEHAAITILGVGAAFIGFCLLGAVVNALDEGELTTAEAIAVFCAKYRVPYSTHKVLQRYFRSLDGLQGTVPKGDLFEKLSPTLARELLLEIHTKWICKLPFYDTLAGPYDMGGHPRQGRGVAEKSCRLFAQIAMRMQPALFISRERPPPRRMYVLISGVVVNTVTRGICRPGDNWGAMLTISDSRCLLDMYCAVNVVQVVYMTHEGLEACVEEHPDFEVRRAQARPRTQRPSAPPSTAS